MSQNVMPHDIPPHPAGSGDPDWQLIAESLPHIVWMASADGRIEYVNRHGNEYLGWPAGAGDDRGGLTFLHPADVCRVSEAWNRAVATQAAFSIEHRIRRRDGKFRWHLVKGLPLRGADGQVVRWLGTATDVDDRKRIEARVAEALRKREEELAVLTTLYADAPVGLGFVDRDCRLVRANSALASMGRRPMEQLVGHPVAELVPTMWEQLQPVYGQLFEGGEPVCNVTLAAGRDVPDARELMASHYPVRIDGEIVGVGVVAVDVTPPRRERPAGRLASLTSREQDVLGCLREGLSNPAIAKRLGLTPNTVRNHVQRILYKLDVHSKLEAVVLASREGPPGRSP